MLLRINSKHQLKIIQRVMVCLQSMGQNYEHHQQNEKNKKRDS